MIYHYPIGRADSSCWNSKSGITCRSGHASWLAYYSFSLDSCEASWDPWEGPYSFTNDVNGRSEISFHHPR